MDIGKVQDMLNCYPWCWKQNINIYIIPILYKHNTYTKHKDQNFQV